MTDFKKKYLKYKYKYQKLIGGLVNINSLIDEYDKNFDSDRFHFQRLNEFYSQLIDRKYDTYYIFENSDINYIMYDNEEQKLIFINNNGDIEENYQKFLNILEDYREVNRLPEINTFLKDINFQLKKFSKISNCGSLNIIDLNIKLEELNIKLQEHYPQLSLQLNKRVLLSGNKATYNYNINHILLCLYYNGDCISSITFLLAPERNILEIMSFTHEEMLGKKYNKLLRSVALILSQLILCDKGDIQYMFSSAENPISVWLLCSNFDCIVSDEKMNFEGEHTFSEHNPYTQDELKDNFKSDQFYGVDIKVPINEINIEKANNLFEKLISEGDNSIGKPLIGGGNFEEIILNTIPNRLNKRFRKELTPLIEMDLITNAENFNNIIIMNNIHLEINTKNYPLKAFFINGSDIFNIWRANISVLDFLDMIKDKINFLQIPLPTENITNEETINEYLPLDLESLDLELNVPQDFDKLFDYLLNYGNHDDYSTYIFGDCNYKNTCLQDFGMKSQEYYNYSSDVSDNYGDIIISLATGKGIGELFIIYKILLKIQSDLQTGISGKIIRYPKKIIFYDNYISDRHKRVVLRFMFIMQLIFQTQEPIMCYYFKKKEELDSKIYDLINNHHISYTFSLNVQGSDVFCDKFVKEKYINTFIEDDDICHNIYADSDGFHTEELKIKDIVY